MPALQPGTTLEGRFVLEEEAGGGGMAVVFRATDLRGHPETRTSFILDHFAREAEILATVRHPYIVSYVAHGCTADGAAYLVVEWLDGESLGARLRPGPLTIAAAVQLGARLADALRATHARGVVHRDLKPDNIFLRQGELARIALLDFGVGQEQLTRTAIELLRSECAAGPLVLVLEDLHWADAASLRILDAALRELAEAPLLILGLGRPEVHERFPALWQHRRRFEIPLRGLPRRACERLIREVLGSPRTAAVEARIIAQAAGNALFLEETMRRVRPAYILRR